jgi:RNA polymerase sigma-70 factor (ECF subfamily)
MAADTLRTRVLHLASCSNERAASPERERLELGAVYEQYFDYVWRCLRSLGLGDAVLDDAVQDVFLVVHDRLAEFDGRARLSTWLYAIVIRIARKYRARAARNGPAVPAAEPAEDRDPERTLQHGEQVALAQRALARLDADKREVFVLAMIEQLSAPEIAEIAGVSVNTVYSRLRAARLLFDAQVARLQLRDTKRSR